jgi:RND superfamily putative drug exporter
MTTGQREEGTMNIAYRAGRWSAAHWKTATLLWLLVVIGATVAGNLAGTVSLTNSEQGNGQSALAGKMLNNHGFPDHAGETVLVQNNALKASGSRFRNEIRTVVARLSTLPQVDSLKSPLAAGNAGQIAKNGHAAVVTFNMAGDPDTAQNRVQPVLNTVASLQRTSGGFTVAEFGDASGNRAEQSSINGGVAKAEELSLPITFLILLIGFGAVVAAGIPVLLGFSAVLGAGGLAAVASHVVHASGSTSSVMLLMGMAVGVDYSLFYLKREREERRAGYGHREALGRAAATSGHAVLTSGITVMIAMAGMLLTGSKVFDSIGVGAMLVVLTAMVGSLSVLPALLGRLGDKVDRGRVRRPQSQSRLWNMVLAPVLRFPLPAAIASTALLVLLALPTLGLHTTLLGPGDLPRSVALVKNYDKIQKAFPGTEVPAVVAVRGTNLDSAHARAVFAQFKRDALASGEVKSPIEISFNRARTTAQILVPLVGSGSNTASMKALETLRNRLLPESIARIHGSTVAVTGQTAGTYDFNALIKGRFPLVFGFVLGLAFLLLLLTFRSLVIPLTSIVLNLLSVGAAYGVLVWIFQRGHLQSLLGFHSDGAVVTWLPLFLFAILFGLSMDYHVFIVSRIKELHDEGLPTAEAVTKGISSTAGTVTAAAAVMVAVFAVFAWLPTLDIKQMGVGLAVAVLLDATVVRGILLPATMKMLGDLNWYLPKGLGWLPRRAPGRLAAPEAAIIGRTETV